MLFDILLYAVKRKFYRVVARLTDRQIGQAQLVEYTVWYFYILKSQTDNKLYFGSTNDLRRRFLEHNSGQVRSTKPRIPFDLIYYEAYSAEDLVRKRERTIKSSRGSRASLLKRINIGE